jgi:tetratricopeptide (TPR) repeat protein
MQNQPLIRILPFLLVILLALAGCSRTTADQVKTPPDAQQTQSVDSGCAYFYFLRGSQAEYNQLFDEALNAYQKVIACDPTATYINEKIPILYIKMGKIEEAKQWLQKFVAVHPDQNTQRLLLAEIEIHSGNLPDATRLYGDAMKLDSENQSIILRLALLYSQQGEPQKAIELLKAFLEKNKTSYQANLYLARIYAQAGNSAEAAERYEIALNLNWSKDLVMEIAEFNGTIKNLERSLSLYRSILAIDPRDEAAGLGVVQTLIAMDQEKAAIAELTKLRAISKDRERMDLIESQIYLNSGKIEAAQKILLAILKKSRSTQADYLLAITYLNQKKTDAALRSLKKIAPTSNEFDSGVLLQIRILQGEKRLSEALQLLEKIIADPATRKPVYYALLSSLYQEVPDQQQALKVLTEGVTQYPDNAQLYYELGVLQENSGIHEQAMTSMEKALQLQPDNPDFLNFIGYSWADENRNLDQALDYIKRAIAVKPDNGFIRDSLGWVYYRLGDFIRAVAELETAVSMEPDDPQIAAHLGDAYVAQGKKEKAMEVYTRALGKCTEEKDKDMIQKKINALNTH